MNRLIHFQCKGRGKMSGATCSVTSKLRLAVFLAAAVVMLQGVDIQAELIPEGVDIFGMTVNYGDGLILNPSHVEVNLLRKEGGVLTVDEATGGGFLEWMPSEELDFVKIEGRGEGISNGEPSEVHINGEIMWGVTNNTGNPAEINFGLVGEAHVDANPFDAFAHFRVTVVSPDGEEIVSDLISATLPPGDFKNFVPLNTQGEPQDDSWSLPVQVILNAGETQHLRVPVEFDGGAFQSSFAGSFSVGLTVTDVQVVPVPGAVLLGSIGLGFAGWKLRRRKEL